MREGNLALESEAMKSSQIFEDVSSIVGKFTKCISLIEQANQSHAIRVISQISKKLHSLSQKYQEEQQRGCITSANFERFADSLLQTITIYSTKYKNCLFPISIRHFIAFLKNIQSQIKKHFQQKLFSKIINTTNTIITNFCSRQTNQIFKHCQQELYHNEQIKTLNNEQNEFLKMDGLELDFCHLKTSSVLVGSNLNQFEKSYLQRNAVISKIITKYYDSCKKRRKQKQAKRNEPKKLTNTVSFNDTVKEQRDCTKDSIRLYKNRLQTCNMKVLKDKVTSLSKDSIANRQLYFSNPNQPKKSYKLKNVYIGLNKRRENSRLLVKQDLIGSNLRKRKAALQTSSINQSYYNGLDYHIINQIDYLHSKLKIPHNRKINSGFSIVQGSYKDVKMGKHCKDDGIIKIIDDLANRDKVIGHVNSTATLKLDNGYKHRKRTTRNVIFSTNRNLGLSLDNTGK